MLKKVVVACAVCVLMAAPAWAQHNYVLDTGDPNERICNPKSYTDLGSGIVRDNVTGFEWQNFSSTAVSSAPASSTLCDSVTWFEAVDYVYSLNDAEYLGYSDWRLPDTQELSTLVDAAHYNPAIDLLFSAAAESYWSADEIDDADAGYVVDFYDGSLRLLYLEYGACVRAVRGARYHLVGNFIINGDGTVNDTTTGLMWQQCNDGQTWDGSGCGGSSATRTWYQAVDYVQTLNDVNYLGYSDWRLPTRNELQSLLNYKTAPLTLYPHSAGYFWSSTENAGDTGQAWQVSLFRGEVDGTPKNSVSPYYYVRAVRGGRCAGSTEGCFDYSDCPEGYECSAGSCLSTSPSRYWTWMSGSNTGNQSGAYGTKGVPGAGNMPGARAGSISWTDNSGNLWLFGGEGKDSAGNNGRLNDLWRYDSGTNVWTWMSGSNTSNQAGVYGTKGVPGAANVPGSRDGSISWTDGEGNLWLFGGNGYDVTATRGYLNDLWRYDPAAGVWTWMSGAWNGNVRGVYGTKGVPDAANVPGARAGSVSWIDSSGNLWLFGGDGKDSAGNHGSLNDLWRYDSGTNVWTWMSGSNQIDVCGEYGIKGVADAENRPGARAGSVSWIDNSGNLWLFGGFGYASYFSFELFPYEEVLNDLWRYEPEMGMWAWMGGSEDGSQAGVYGRKGTPGVDYVPRARYGSISWTDSAGALWLLGGNYYDSSGGRPAIRGRLNDLWRYDPAAGVWTWVSGANIVDRTGVYGAKGTPDIANVPGSRDGSISWIDSSGALWGFGGSGYDGDGSSALLNDLWRFDEFQTCDIDDDCNDGLYCNGAETCDNGTCADGDDPYPCSGAAPYCLEATDSCVECLENSNCDDGAYCNGAETCSNGVCGDSVDPCSGATPVCDEAGDRCVECLADGDCPDDSLFCTGAPACSNNACGFAEDSCGGATPVCDEAGDRCVECLNDSQCDDFCVNNVCVECRNNADCSDNLYCNGAETCISGSCSAGTPPACDDGAYCNGVETCNEATDSCNAGTPPACDDGAYCNGVETCNEATDSCNAGTPPVCDDGAYCNGVETCNEASDSCNAGTSPCSGATPGCIEATDRCVECTNNTHCDPGYRCTGNACAPRGSMRVDKATVKAGKTDGTDSMQFSGWMNATAADVNAAIGGSIIVTIGAADIPDLDETTFTFPVTAATFVSGKYKSPKAVIVNKTDPVVSFAFDSATGLMKFSAKNVDLTGVSCPITVTVQFGDYAARVQMTETIVNSTKPCPLPLLMGVKDTLSASKVAAKKGTTPGTDSVSISGTFTVDGSFSPTQPLIITLGPDTFTVPRGQFLLSNGIYSCKSIDSGNAFITAKFDTVKCTCSIQIKAADISGSGNVAFGLNVFGNALQAAEPIALPPEF